MSQFNWLNLLNQKWIKKKKIHFCRKLLALMFVCTLVQDKFPYRDKKVYRFLAGTRDKATLLTATMSWTLMIRPLM